MKEFLKAIQWTVIFSTTLMGFANTAPGYWDENNFWIERKAPDKRETTSPSQSEIIPHEESRVVEIAPPSKEEECCLETEMCCYDFIYSSLQIGGNYTFVNFKQGSLENVNGHLGGIQLFYEATCINNIYAGVKFLWRQGSLGNNRSLLDFDTQIRLGYSFFDCCDDYLLTLFTGFGWRYFSHEFKKNQTLHFNYNEVYIPVGLLTYYCINSWLSIGLFGTWMPQVFSNVNIVPNDNARWVLENRLCNFRIEIPLIFDIFCLCSYDISFSLKPFYEYWRDGKTKAVTSTGIPLGLPSNRYHFAGFEFNIGLDF